MGKITLTIDETAFGSIGFENGKSFDEFSKEDQIKIITTFQVFVNLVKEQIKE